MAGETIDRTTFEALKTTTGAEFVGELVDTFLVEAPRMLADLRDAHAAGDAPRFRRAAHSLKSNANTFGAQRFAAMAKDLELGGVAQPDNAACLDALMAEFAAVAAALKELRGA
jgi:HPt (histidine-containing phosphotransfer) domain-containing protein